MIISPGAAHSFGIPMIQDDVAIVRELFVAVGISRSAQQSSGSTVSASLQVIAVLGSRAGGGDLRPAELPV